MDLRSTTPGCIVKHRSTELSAPPTFIQSKLLRQKLHAKLACCNMANALTLPGIEDPPPSFRSGVWEYFGFRVKYDPDGKRVVDKNTTVCRKCNMMLNYVGGNTTNMTTHLRRHHPGVKTSGTRHKQQAAHMLQTLPGSFRQPLAHDSKRAKEIDRAIATFITVDMRPFSVVDNARFQDMLRTLEPRYKIPSRTYFTDTAVPALYNKTKAPLETAVSAAPAVALTSDGWTSRATQSYLTVIL